MNREKDLSNDFKMKEQNTINPAPKPEIKNQRQIARKIFLNTIINSEYVIEKEQEPNYLRILPDSKIYRVNVIAIVVSKERVGMISNLLLEDGTDKITARIFEESKAIKNVEVGDCIQLIGKIRVYNEEKYLSPEIIKKIDLIWLKIRDRELKKVTEIKEVKAESKKVKLKEQNREEKKSSDTIEDLSLPSEKIIKIIRELDKGQGVFIEELIEKSPMDRTEKIIEKMLEQGDIFQNLPGKVKVL